MTENLTVNVLCPDQVGFALEDVIKVMRERFGTPARVALPIPGREGSAIVNMGAVNVLVMVEDKPLPLEAARPDDGTPRGGANPLLSHRTHIMVSLLNTPEDQEQKMRSVLLMVQVASAVAGRAASSAVMWSSSGVALPSEQFQDLTARWTTSPDEIPTLLICRVLAYQDGVDAMGQARIGVFSVGLRSFVAQEVELLPRPVAVEVVTKGFDRIANHLLRSGRVLGDGDAIAVPSLGQVKTRFGAVRGGEPASMLICDVDHGTIGRAVVG